MVGRQFWVLFFIYYYIKNCSCFYTFNIPSGFKIFYQLNVAKSIARYLGYFEILVIINKGCCEQLCSYSSSLLIFNDSFFFFLIYLLFIYHLFLAVLGLRFCARAFSSCGKWGPLFIMMRKPLTIVGSLVAEHRLQTHRLSSCGSRTQLLCSMWDLPRPGLEPVSPALAGRFSTTVPPGKPSNFILFFILC